MAGACCEEVGHLVVAKRHPLPAGRRQQRWRGPGGRLRRRGSSAALPLLRPPLLLLLLLLLRLRLLLLILLRGARRRGGRRVTLRRGDVITVETSGGGGFGAPSERDPAAIEADVETGYVTVASAASDYGPSG